MNSKYPSVGPEADDWAHTGRTLSEQRFSPLNEINEDNVDQLGLAWAYKIEDDRGMEATPIVIDGVMYVTGPWSKVYALDATSGKELWKYDPGVDRGNANRTCCDVVNRGVAVSNGKVFVGTLDGRLIALDAKTGREIWSTDTIIDHGRSYAITGAPRLAAGNVVIGNGGSEFGVRGYTSAFDEDTGKLSWRFYSVPGADAPAPDDKAMQLAKPTWFGDRYPKFGGGGTVWDSLAYDPDLGLLYIGVGNGSIHSRKLRSEGKGDNLFLSSIVAVNAKTGKYVWHFQTTPGDEWDFTATQNMILADMKIDGKDRKVIMQAPKNGYFFTLDRVTGQFISGNNFVPVNWSKGLDKNGRPIVDDEAARYEDGKLKLVTPSIYGGHSWQPMSYSPKTGLVYIPAIITAWYFQQVNEEDYPKAGVFGAYKFGYIGAAGVPPKPGDSAPKATDIPNLALAADEKKLRESWTGKLIAWDPIKQKAVWTQDYITISNGGTLATGGDLVFQGTADGRFVAYRATDGKKLWQTEANTGVMAGPISYRVKGEQYVAVAAGWGGAFPLFSGVLSNLSGSQPDARILVYKLGGTAKLPPKKVMSNKAVTPLLASIDPEKVKAGYLQFAINCSACHGLEAVSGGIVPDLRKMDASTVQNFHTILKGAYASVGMPNFSKRLSDEQMDQILHYLAQRNADLRSIQQQAAQNPK
nr:PQQ-dependent dehydrogenase, methanol/ethanol family [Sphingobium subterraneum]